MLFSFGKWRLTWLKSSEYFPEPGSCSQTFCPIWIGKVKLAGQPMASRGAGGGLTGQCLVSWQRGRWIGLPHLIRDGVHLSICWATSEKLCRWNSKDEATKFPFEGSTNCFFKSHPLIQIKSIFPRVWNSVLQVSSHYIMFFRRYWHVVSNNLLCQISQTNVMTLHIIHENET